jgi:hypothetical protein
MCATVVIGTAIVTATSLCILATVPRSKPLTRTELPAPRLGRPCCTHRLRLRGPSMTAIAIVTAKPRKSSSVRSLRLLCFRP